MKYLFLSATIAAFLSLVKIILRGKGSSIAAFVFAVLHSGKYWRGLCFVFIVVLTKFLPTIYVTTVLIDIDGKNSCGILTKPWSRENHDLTFPWKAIRRACRGRRLTVAHPRRFDDQVAHRCPQDHEDGAARSK